MKRDLRINVSEMMEIWRRINEQKEALEDVRRASRTFLRLIEKQESQTYEELSKQWNKKIDKNLWELHEKLDIIADIMRTYLGEMQWYMVPKDSSVEMRVDRNDIWMNYCSIARCSSDFSEILCDTQSSWQDYKQFYIPNFLADEETNKKRKKN